jgi:hypothetical protein
MESEICLCVYKRASGRRQQYSHDLSLIGDVKEMSLAAIFNTITKKDGIRKSKLGHLKYKVHEYITYLTTV